MMNRYSSVLPPCLLTSSPAALAEPPIRNDYNLYMRIKVFSLQTCCQKVVYNKNILARCYRAGLHLEGILDPLINSHNENK